MAKGQFTSVQDSDRKWSVCSSHMWIASTCSTHQQKRKFIKEVKIPLQELNSRGGEGRGGDIFSKRAYCQEDTVLTLFYFSSNSWYNTTNSLVFIGVGRNTYMHALYDN